MLELNLMNNKSAMVTFRKNEGNIHSAQFHRNGCLKMTKQLREKRNLLVKLC